MSGRSRSYKEGLHRRLRKNVEALTYLQVALEDSQAAFLVALKNVLEARNVAAVARASNLDRGHIYRMLSGQGNPTFNSLEKLLQALGLRITLGLENSSNVWHAQWHQSIAYAQNGAFYAPIPRSARIRASLQPEPGTVGGAGWLGASTDPSDAEAGVFSSASEFEELCEMAL